MRFTDPHDPREFLRFAKIDADGHIIALVERDVCAPAPDECHVDISKHGYKALDHPDVVATVKHAHEKRHGR